MRQVPVVPGRVGGASLAGQKAGSASMAFWAGDWQAGGSQPIIWFSWCVPCFYDADQFDLHVLVRIAADQDFLFVPILKLYCIT